MHKNAAPDETRLSFAELITLSLKFNDRLDQLWQRVLYSHAAIVGVMVFFGTSDQVFAVSRVLVFGFYTANMIITMFAFHEALSGMRAVMDDLQAMQRKAKKTHLQGWILTRNYNRHSAVRLMILGITWLLLGYLLVLPLI